MDDSPLISIIIPVYNAEDCLSKCLESIKNQTFRDYECIFINDCSTDRSRDIISNFSAENQRVSLIDHDANRGVAAARNTGLNHAKGEYIYFLDADDWIEPNTLHVLSQAATVHSTDIIGIEWFLSYNTNERIMTQPDVKSPEDAFYHFTAGRLRWNLWLFMTKKSLYHDNNIHFIEGMNMGEDMMATGKLIMNAQTIEIIHQPLYHYIQTNDNSLTKEISDRHLAQLKGNLDELENYVKKNATPQHIEWINFLKLNVKLPLLFTGKYADYKNWQILYPESNRYIMKNRLLPTRTKIIQWFGANKMFWAIKIYYIFVFRFIYGVIYK